MQLLKSQFSPALVRKHSKTSKSYTIFTVLAKRSIQYYCWLRSGKKYRIECSCVFVATLLNFHVSSFPVLTTQLDRLSESVFEEVLGKKICRLFFVDEYLQLVSV